MVRLTASDFYTYHRPSKCELRIYFRHRGEKERPPSPYEEVLRRLGERHERAHLATFPDVVDLSSGTIEDRIRRTKEEFVNRSSVIYQAVLKASWAVQGTECEVLGEPDFLILDSGDYVIRDAKISRRITERDHPEILRQLELYGWLYHQMFGVLPSRLEVYSGTGDIVEVAYESGNTVLRLLEEIHALKTGDSEHYNPVGWSKCNGCGFYEHCWTHAEKNQDVALVSGVDQGLAIALHREGVYTIPDLLAQFDEDTLTEFQRPWGAGTQRVGRKASTILQMAQALDEMRGYILETPNIPNLPNYVMFDVEGLPPQLDELDKVYLWGLRVYGAEPSEYQAATTGFGSDGDRQGWDDFLKAAETIFERYGDIPFIHWHHYERSRINAYVERFGDMDGIAARVQRNLLDLFRITERSVILPLPSYSLKVVERYVGFERTQEDYGGEWAMAKYIEATETQDAKERDEVMEQIKTYNREDLDAMWAVLNWLKSKRI